MACTVGLTLRGLRRQRRFEGWLSHAAGTLGLLWYVVHLGLQKQELLLLLLLLKTLVMLYLLACIQVLEEISCYPENHEVKELRRILTQPHFMVSNVKCTQLQTSCLSHLLEGSITSSRDC